MASQCELVLQYVNWYYSMASQCEILLFWFLCYSSVAIIVLLTVNVPIFHYLSAN